MYGRYGGDQLGIALIVFSIILSFVTMLIPVHFIGVVSLVPLTFCVYRMFSKNIHKRQRENYNFLIFWRKVKGFFTGIKADVKARKNYRFYSCPKCSQKLRIPKGKGKVSVKCPKCAAQFTQKT